jgi:alkylation response protein AidB-like acyl-CoA dehydrogenase
MVGWNWADTSALSFSDVRVPVSNLLGEEGGAMKIMMSTFTEDRLQIAARCIGAATTALRLTVEYVKQRKAFGQRIADFQNTQFVLAEVRTDVDVARTYLDHALLRARQRGLTVAEGAMLKLWATEMEGRVVDKCLQLFGGAGMMQDTPIGPMYTAARIQRIYAGTSELQKVSIARDLLSG